jgi:uncharacterized protein YjdB
VRAAASGAAATAAVAVSAVPVARVAVAPATASIRAGATQEFTATTTDAAGATITGRVVAWSSRDPGIAVVSSTGQVTGIAPGSATIVASVEGQSATATVLVTSAPPTVVPVASVRVTPGSASIPAGGSAQLAAEPRDANGNVLSGRAVAWSSSDQNVATVTSDGRVFGANPGNATVRATSEGVTGSATITVTATVRVSPTAVNVRDRGNTNRTAQLIATDHNGRVLSSGEVTWSSSNAGIASVSTNGLVRGESSGSGTATAIITVTYRGATATATVTVTRD